MPTIGEDLPTLLLMCCVERTSSIVRFAERGGGCERAGSRPRFCAVCAGARGLLVAFGTIDRVADGQIRAALR